MEDICCEIDYCIDKIFNSESFYYYDKKEQYDIPQMKKEWYSLIIQFIEEFGYKLVEVLMIFYADMESVYFRKKRRALVMLRGFFTLLYKTYPEQYGKMIYTYNAEKYREKMAQNTKQLMEKMRETYMKEDEEKIVYKLYKNRKRILDKDEAIFFKVNQPMISKQVTANGKTWENHSVVGFFTDTKGDNIGEDECLLMIPQGTVNSMNRFDIEFLEGKTYRIYGGNEYTPKGAQYPQFPVNVSPLKSKTVDNTKEDKKYVKANDIEEIDFDDDLLDM